ncbi:MAG: hypothetical protein ABIP51_02005 [Bacteroidia bacterium]
MFYKKDCEELNITLRALAFQKVEIETLTDELTILKKDFTLQNTEKQKRAEELMFANKELAFQNSEKHKRAEELILANTELIFQKEEKAKRAEELTIAYNELKKTEEYLKEYIKGLEEIMFITSHKVRQPVAHILGISNLLDVTTEYSLEELKQIVGYVKHSANALEDFTKELSTSMVDIKAKTNK